MHWQHIYKGLRRINVKTIYINFHYFPFNQAIKLPIWVNKHCWIATAKGKIIINAPIKTGMIEIGYGEIGIFDRKHSRSIWQIKGTLIFNGKTQIGHGSKLSVETNAVLSIGNNFRLTAESTIVCHQQITIGDDCLISWDVLIMDTDMHSIKNEHGVIMNEPKPINIGNRVWIACRSLILKGVDIADGNVIAATSVITHSVKNNNSIIGANPQRVLQENIRWEL